MLESDRVGLRQLLCQNVTCASIGPGALEAAGVCKKQANPTARDCPDRQGVRSLGKEPRIF